VSASPNTTTGWSISTSNRYFKLGSGGDGLQAYPFASQSYPPQAARSIEHDRFV
jgi:hypothetical protein